MKNIYTNDLIARPEGSSLDAMPIHVGDTVYLQPRKGPAIKGVVIFDTPVFGTTTYTSETAGRVRARFRHCDVHGIEPLRGRKRSSPRTAHAV